MSGLDEGRLELIFLFKVVSEALARFIEIKIWVAFTSKVCLTGMVTLNRGGNGGVREITHLSFMCYRLLSCQTFSDRTATHPSLTSHHQRGRDSETED